MENPFLSSNMNWVQDPTEIQMLRIKNGTQLLNVCDVMTLIDRKNLPSHFFSKFKTHFMMQNSMEILILPLRYDTAYFAILTP